MKLKELLNITTLDSIIKIEGIDSNRIKKDIITINCKNEYGRIDSTAIDNIVSSHGSLEVIHQYIKNDNLIILIKL